jgi:rod shape-determining protein MreC
MKSRVVFFLLLLVALLVTLSQKNQTVQHTILKIVNPVKQFYKQFTQEVEDRSKSYIFQKESIEKLTKENKVLKKYLLDQTLYLQQVNTLYQKLPSLEKLPYKSIVLVDTISYVKLNSFDEVLLTTPKKTKLLENHVYGLIQKNSIGGTAVVRGGNLYGYLSSNPRCKFSVFIGKNRTPGIVQGVDKETMLIKYIPKWANIKAGDRVETSGLDGIFFSNIPVGMIESVKIENSYKTAYIKSFTDTLHPDFFFLITDTTPRLVSYYDQNTSFSDKNYTKLPTLSTDEKNITSIPQTLQTKESEVDLSEFEIPKEKITIEPVRKPLTTPKINNTNNKNMPIKIKQSSIKRKAIPIPKKEKKRRNPLDIFR